MNPKIKVRVISSAINNGIADESQYDQGTNLGTLFEMKLPGQDRTGWKLRVRRQGVIQEGADDNFVLREGDVVSIVAVNQKGGRQAA
jgi:hypothetical protein